jgi:hypothetical protein
MIVESGRCKEDKWNWVAQIAQIDKAAEERAQT